MIFSKCFQICTFKEDEKNERKLDKFGGKSEKIKFWRTLRTCFLQLCVYHPPSHQWDLPIPFRSRLKLTLWSFFSLQFWLLLRVNFLAHPTSTRHFWLQKKCCLQKLVTCIWITSGCYRVLGRCPGGQATSMCWFKTSWGALSRNCSEVSVWYQTSIIVPIESNFYNTCPTEMKLNQSGQDMSLPIVIQFGGNPGCNRKVTLFFYLLELSSLMINVLFCHEDGGGKLCKLKILVVVS